ncbi:hypothetical protein LJR029_004009 [Caballeronia sp. LjRoot29]
MQLLFAPAEQLRMVLGSPAPRAKSIHHGLAGRMEQHVKVRSNDSGVNVRNTIAFV